MAPPPPLDPASPAQPGRQGSGEYPAVRESARVPRRSNEEVASRARALARLPISLNSAWEFGELLSSAGLLPEVVRDPNRDKPHPRFREIARRLQIEKTKFWRIVQLHATLTRFPWLREALNVRSAHVHAVRGLPHAQQNALLRRAEDESWTCRELVTFMRYGERREVHAFVSSVEAVCVAISQAVRYSEDVGTGVGDQTNEIVQLFELLDARWLELNRATAPLRARLAKGR